MHILNMLEKSLPFIVIALMIIVIVIVAYFTFVNPKSRKKDYTNKSVKNADIEKNIIKKTEKKDQEKNKDQVVQPSSDSNKHDKEMNDLDDKDSVENDNENQTEELKSADESDQSQSNQKEKESESEKPVELGKYHVLYRGKDDKWIVKREGSDKTIRVLHTKKEAIAYATIKAINQDTNIIIHGEDGKIEKHGY